MATKIIKEIVTDVGGNTTIEFSDDTTQKYNVADVVTAQVNPLTGGGSFSTGPRTNVIPSTFTLKAALGIAGQSNEQGSTKYQDALGNWVRGSACAPSQGIYEPVKLNSAGFGSMFVAATELLASDGIKVDLFNGAVGGASLPSDWCGYILMGNRSSSTAYRGKRASLGTGDPGHRGDFVFANAATWECTTGNKHLVFWGDAQAPVTVAGGAYYSDPGSIIKETTLLSSATPPTFPGSPAVSNTVIDGALTWTCIAVGALVTDGDSKHVFRYAEDGFDPYGMCLRLRNALMGSSVAPDKRFVYLQNGQADAGGAGAVYQVGLRELVRYYGAAPNVIQAIVGLSIYYPAQTQANWDVLETVLSGGGLASSPNYATSGLTTALTGLGYHNAVLGAAITSFGYYYGPSLYRAFGVSTLGMLQPSDPHVTLLGMNQCAAVIAPALSKIIRNSAT